MSFFSVCRRKKTFSPIFGFERIFIRFLMSEIDAKDNIFYFLVHFMGV